MLIRQCHGPSSLCDDSFCCNHRELTILFTLVKVRLEVGLQPLTIGSVSKQLTAELSSHFAQPVDQMSYGGLACTVTSMIVAQFLRIDPMVNGSNPTSSKSEEGCQLSVIPGVRMTRCGHIETKDLDTA